MKEHPYASFIHQVEKPARYIGGEYNSVAKDWDQIDVNLALCFPDIYDIGMSHLGTKILYSLVNKTDDLCAERVFCPWFDMEQALRDRDLPLLSLESHRPLCDFDIVGFSLQYELTFTNILTMMDLGRVPLHREDRTLDDPLVIAGGPVATHPEPMAPFIDVFLIGDAEERLPRLMRHYQELRKAGELSRDEILAELAKEGGVYCPALYTREICDRSGLLVLSRPKFPNVPEVVDRAFLDDISRYRFPDDSPVAVAEAIFDRMSIEIARGCTEGCRFCQAGMIYRPVRERDPDEIVDTLISALDKGGYDEASITSLSTADYSCVSPLIKRLMDRLRERKVSLGISSLRAYGLDEDLLDEIESVKATGLTFAPEAGTQRMRDVINKNITEEDIYNTCHRVFARSWSKIKLYFILGLPTEQDEDILGIAKMGKQAIEIGNLYHKRKMQVVVSVSSHVPKPHTPFQWCAMDSLDEIKRKQDILRNLSKKWGYKLRTHEMKVSHLEGIITRGDYRTGWLIEDAWRRGARFDGWDEHLRWADWQNALEAWEEKFGVDRFAFLQTIPVDARLPWDHIDVGLAEGFLLQEYQKSLKSRLSPPCGKPKGAQVHHTNLQESKQDERRLVCYHCGIACDMSQMKGERQDFLTKLDAIEPPKPREENYVATALDRIGQGLTPHDFKQGEKIRYRLRYTKFAPVSLQGHQDMLRVLPRLMRRAKLSLYYSEGYSPKPVLTFGPALSLGIQSLCEHVDISLTNEVTAEDLLQRLNHNTPDGLHFTGTRALGLQDKGFSKVLKASSYVMVLRQTQVDAIRALWLANNPGQNFDIQQVLQARCDELMEVENFPITVIRKAKDRTLDLKDKLQQLSVVSSDSLPARAAFEPGLPAIRLDLLQNNSASIRPAEIFEGVFGTSIPLHHIVRLGCWTHDENGEILDPLYHCNGELPADSISELSVEAANALRRGHVVEPSNLMPNSDAALEQQQAQEEDPLSSVKQALQIV